MAEPAARHTPTVDVERLTMLLEVLASGNRLELLSQLREPKTASEVVLHPPRAKAGENPERSISKQAVRVHLAKLLEIGVIAPRKARRGSIPVEEYVVNQQRLFAIAEDFRKLGSLRPALPPGVEQTMDGSMTGVPTPEAGVRLILVHGLDEGRPFFLRREDLVGERGWVIGRRRGIAVSLDYDPFVSSENCEVTVERGQFMLHDLRSSRNGTLLNWDRLPKGGSRPLENGDVIGVGRSLLLFRRD